MRKLSFLIASATLLFFSACKKSSEDFQTPQLNDYYPLTVGKYITYNLDSTVWLNFGQTQAVHSYQVKHVVDAQITDNLGRPAYRIIRFIRSSPTAAWVADNTFMAVPTDQAVEFIENNLRYIKMHLPIRDGYTWKGNSYIDTYSLNSNLKYLNDWDYNYDSLDVTAKIGALTVENTLRVFQRDELLGNPAVSTSYVERNIGIEKYAKGIGMVYRQFLHTEFQPAAFPAPAHYVDASYGVTLTMIDHN